MTYKVEILPAAWEDLKRIEDWYAIQFDVETALRVSGHILDAMERLESFPDSGSRIAYSKLELSYSGYSDRIHEAVF